MKYWFLGTGIVIFCAGAMSLPFSGGVSPYNWLSFFDTIVSLGGFYKFAIILMIVGILLIFVSLLIPRKDF